MLHITIETEYEQANLFSVAKYRWPCKEGSLTLTGIYIIILCYKCIFGLGGLVFSLYSTQPNLHEIVALYVILVHICIHVGMPQR